MIALAMPDLESLEMDSTSVMTDEAWVALGRLRRLRRLKLAMHPTGNDVIPEAFCEAPVLQELDLECGTSINLPRKGMSKLTALRTLSLTRWSGETSDPGGGSFRPHMELPPKLQELRLFKILLRDPAIVAAFAPSVEVVYFSVPCNITPDNLLCWKSLPHLRSFHVRVPPAFQGGLDKKKLKEQFGPALEFSQ